jgi:DNA-binding transcriptional regulator YiaG
LKEIQCQRIPPKNTHCVKKSSSSRPTRTNAEARAVIAQRLKYLLSDAGLKVPEAAKLLQVTERTVYAWISGRTAVPFAAYKLLRLLRWFELPGPWDGWLMHSGKLWSPEGLGFDPSDSAWWGILVRKAAQFDAQCKLNAKLQVRVAELCSMLDDARGVAGNAPCDRGTRALGAVQAPPPGLEVLVTPQNPAKTGQQSAAGGEVPVTPHKRLKTELAAAAWSVESLSGRWFNYDRGQTYRGDK